jgi:UDP-2,4-diacetamido-2,4,6-trideoxy-beta-L-altropyranose hydrolase
MRTLEIATAHGSQNVVIDHYGANTQYLQALREAGLRVGVIDDRADSDLSAADWILNQNIAAHRIEYRTRPNTPVLRGLRYALLRPEFAQARAQLAYSQPVGDARVLITLGGGATASLCVSLLGALERVERPLSVRCIASDADRQLERAASNSRHAVEVLGMLDDVIAQMTWASVSINAGGSTCWELLCLGVPMVVLTLSDDQRLNPPALEAGGIAVAAGGFDAAADAVAMLLADPVRMRSMAARGMELVDGLGAHRVAATLLEGPLAIRGRAHASC